MNDPSQLVQVVGALLILAAFAGVQFKAMDPASWTYLWLNVVGSAILAVLAWLGRDWGFLLLEGVWALVSAYSLARKPRARDSSRRSAETRS